MGDGDKYPDPVFYCHNDQCIYERITGRRKSNTVPPGLIMSQLLCIYDQQSVDARNNNSQIQGSQIKSTKLLALSM